MSVLRGRDHMALDFSPVCQVAVVIPNLVNADLKGFSVQSGIRDPLKDILPVCAVPD